MDYYIIDDEIGTVKTLENIIEMRNIGRVVGYQTNPEKAIDEIILIQPDIVLVDLLMSKIDGITLVSLVKKHTPSVNFIMISQVKDKEMVEQAYNSGIEFFINKPINVIEVEQVLKNVSEKLEMNNIVKNIKGMLKEDTNKTNNTGRYVKDVNRILGLLGMLGEKGTGDLMLVLEYMMEHNVEYDKKVLELVALKASDSVKNMEQRMRRAMKKGLINVANIGIEDYGNEIFQTYANYVYDFKSIKDEMECIKGYNNTGGRINISKFIEGVILYSKTVG